ncbi:HAD-IIA family hydrolase [Actinoplanes sp. CA-030573]|uniref:HAD-IIA family hydrolase n=1 Tax=Actinoplanes sp. CA-030573 TaxID=3239898 RepID=UPI003D901261
MLLLIDLDGTTYTSEGAIEGAAAALAQLRAEGHMLRFLTNTDSRSTASMLALVRARGAEVARDELFTSLTAAEELLAAEGPLVDGGVRVFAVTNDEVAAQLGERFSLGGGSGVTHVVVGDVRASLSYDLLDEAFRALRGGARLIALQKGRFFLDGGEAHLDTGAFVAGLEFGAGVEATVVGKPSVAFLELAVRSTGEVFARGDIWVVGDDVTTDVRMGRDAGARTVLVRTGKYRLQRDRPGTPDHVIDSLAVLPALLRGAKRG